MVWVETPPIGWYILTNQQEETIFHAILDEFIFEVIFDELREIPNNLKYQIHNKILFRINSKHSDPLSYDDQIQSSWT